MSQPRTEDRFSRYTDRAQSVIALAHRHAQRLRQASVDTEHLLLGITDAGEGVASMALAALNISLDTVRHETMSHTSPGQTTPRTPIPFSAAADSVLERAEREADTLGHHQVGTDHLLLALAAESSGRAAQALARLGLSDDRLRAVILRQLNAYTRGRQTGDEPTPEHVIGGRRLALPGALTTYNEDIAEARWQKELAIDAQEYEAAAEWRTEEKRLLAAKLDLVNSWAAGIGTVALVDEIDRLYRQAERLRDLLHQHGIAVTQPDPDRTSHKTRERRPAPTPAPPVVERPTDTTADHVESGGQARTVVAPAEAVANPDSPSVNIRGWLEGDHDQIALVRQSIHDTIHQEWYNFCWRFPPEQGTGHWYAFYGAHIDAASVGWFINQLYDFANLAPETASDQLHGLFLATGPNGETVRWLVRNRQVLTVPGDPAQEQLDI